MARLKPTAVRVVWTPVLGWLRRLPEGGTICELATKEETLMAKRADLEKELADLQVRLEAVRAEAEREAQALWTAGEIAAAKSVENGKEYAR